MAVEVTDDRSVFIGNLGYTSTEESLARFFSVVGPVRSTRVARLPDGRSKGVGFVEFASVEDAKEAVERFNEKEVDGRKCYLRIASEPILPHPPNKNRREAPMVYSEPVYSEPPIARRDPYGYMDDRMRYADPRARIPQSQPQPSSSLMRRREMYEESREYEERRRLEEARRLFPNDRRLVANNRDIYTDDRRRVLSERGIYSDDRRMITGERRVIPDERRMYQDDRRRIEEARRYEERRRYEDGMRRYEGGVVRRSDFPDGMRYRPDPMSGPYGGNDPLSYLRN